MPLSTPVAWYNAENTADSGPNGYTLTNVNSVSFANSGVIGNCGTFVAASSKKLTKSDEVALRINDGDFSLTLWINSTTISGWPGIIGKGTSAQGWCVFFNSTSDNVLLFYLGGNVDTINLSTGFSTGSWQHMMIVRSAGTVTVYRNNVSVGSKSITGTTTGTQELSLGFCTGDGAYFDGKLDLVGIYDYAFSSDDRDDLYNGGAGYDPFGGGGGGSSSSITTLLSSSGD